MYHYAISILSTHINVYYAVMRRIYHSHTDINTYHWYVISYSQRRGQRMLMMNLMVKGEPRMLVSTRIYQC